MSPTAATRTPAPTILVVEDEVIVRMVISEYLRDCGYRVVEAWNADEALTVLKRKDIKIDLVFSDVEMPGEMDGFALSTWIRTNLPEVDVILTGTPSRTIKAAEEFCEEGPLPKPYESQSVLDRIKRLCAQRNAHGR